MRLMAADRAAELEVNVTSQAESLKWFTPWLQQAAQSTSSGQTRQLSHFCSQL